MSVLCFGRRVRIMESSMTRIFILAMLCFPTGNVAGPIVQTTAGLIEGYTEHITERLYLGVDRDIDVYLGIPFAEPPTGRFRFANPVEKTPWDEVWNATFFRPICPQVLPGSLAGESEDCLYLNIYAPPPEEALLPVMVWIHGGAYNAGAGGRVWYSGLPLAALGDVIVVTINYRLGPLGFLSTGDDVAPGNFGMMDQILALSWIKENIASFGGDAGEVTLFGQSAGATSIGLHLLSPLSHDLFKYAIMQSGSTLTPFAFTDDSARARDEAFRVGEILGCPTSTSRVLIECLRTKTTSQIMASALSFLFLSAPVIDGVFLPDHPEAMVASGRFKRTNIIIGTNRDEGTAWALSVFPSSANADTAPRMDRATYDVWHGRYTYGFINDLILNAMNQEYFDWTKVDDADTDYMKAFVDEITDQTFVAPADTLSRAFHAHGAGDVYMYHMTHVPSVSAYQITPRDIGPGWLGVTHGEDFQFVFGWSFIPEVEGARSRLRPDEITFAVDVMVYWTNFAKSGNPNNPETALWPAFTLPDLDYIRLEPAFRSAKALRADTCNFWNSYVPDLVRVSQELDPVGEATKTSRRYHSEKSAGQRLGTSRGHRPGLSWSEYSWTTEHVRRSYPSQYWAFK